MPVLLPGGQVVAELAVAGDDEVGVKTGFPDAVATVAAAWRLLVGVEAETAKVDTDEAAWKVEVDTAEAAVDGVTEAATNFEAWWASARLGLSLFSLVPFLDSVEAV